MSSDINNIVKLASQDPIRSPSWRWDLIVSLASSGKISSNIKDKWIKQGLQLWAKRNFPEKIAGTNLEPLWLAHRIYSWDAPARWIIEARILAGCSDEEIAKLSAADPKVVAAYEALFFNVRDRLDSPDYILTNAIGPATAIVSHSNLEPVWKLYGYFGGPKLLDYLAYRFPGGRVTSLNDLRAFAIEAIKGSVELQAMVAARAMKVSSKQAIPLINTYLKMINYDEESKEKGGTNKLINAISRVVDSIEVKVKDKPEEKVDEPSLSDLKKS